MPTMYLNTLQQLGFKHLSSEQKVEGRISKLSSISRQLLQAHCDGYHPRMSLYLATALKSVDKILQRYIRSRPRHQRKTPEFVAEVRREIQSLHEYNLKTAEVRSKYPRSEQLDAVLVEYVDLECELLYDSVKEVDKEAEKSVTEKVLRLLRIIFYDAFHVKDIPSKKSILACDKALLNLIADVRVDFPLENGLLSTIILELVQKLNLLDEINKLKHKHIPLHEDTFLRDPQFDLIRSNLTYSNVESYIDDESDDEMDAVVPVNFDDMFSFCHEKKTNELEHSGQEVGRAYLQAASPVLNHDSALKKVSCDIPPLPDDANIGIEEVPDLQQSNEVPAILDSTNSLSSPNEILPDKNSGPAETINNGLVRNNSIISKPAIDGSEKKSAEVESSAESVQDNNSKTTETTNGLITIELLDDDDEDVSNPSANLIQPDGIKLETNEEQQPPNFPVPNSDATNGDVSKTGEPTTNSDSTSFSKVDNKSGSDSSKEVEEAVVIICDSDDENCQIEGVVGERSVQIKVETVENADVVSTLSVDNEAVSTTCVEVELVPQVENYDSGTVAVENQNDSTPVQTGTEVDKPPTPSTLGLTEEHLAMSDILEDFDDDSADSLNIEILYAIAEVVEMYEKRSEATVKEVEVFSDARTEQNKDENKVAEVMVADAETDVRNEPSALDGEQIKIVKVLPEDSEETVSSAQSALIETNTGSDNADQAQAPLSGDVLEDPEDRIAQVTEEAQDGSGQVLEGAQDGSVQLPEDAQDGSAQVTEDAQDGRAQVEEDARDGSAQLMEDAQDGSVQVAEDAQDGSAQVIEDAQHGSAQVPEDVQNRNADNTSPNELVSLTVEYSELPPQQQVGCDLETLALVASNRETLAVKSDSDKETVDAATKRKTPRSSTRTSRRKMNRKSIGRESLPRAVKQMDKSQTKQTSLFHESGNSVVNVKEYKPHDFIPSENSDLPQHTNNVYSIAQKRTDTTSDESNDSCENSLFIDFEDNPKNEKPVREPIERSVFDEETICDMLEFVEIEDNGAGCISIPENDANYQILKQMEDFVQADEATPVDEEIGNQNIGAILPEDATNCSEMEIQEVKVAQTINHSIENILNKGPVIAEVEVTAEVATETQIVEVAADQGPGPVPTNDKTEHIEATPSNHLDKDEKNESVSLESQTQTTDDVCGSKVGPEDLDDSPSRVEDINEKTFKTKAAVKSYEYKEDIDAFFKRIDPKTEHSVQTRTKLRSKSSEHVYQSIDPKNRSSSVDFSILSTSVDSSYESYDSSSEFDKSKDSEKMEVNVTVTKADNKDEPERKTQELIREHNEHNSPPHEDAEAMQKTETVNISLPSQVQDADMTNLNTSNIECVDMEIDDEDNPIIPPIIEENVPLSEVTADFIPKNSEQDVTKINVDKVHSSDKSTKSLKHADAQKGTVLENTIQRMKAKKEGTKEKETPHTEPLVIQQKAGKPDNKSTEKKQDKSSGKTKKSSSEGIKNNDEHQRERSRSRSKSTSLERKTNSSSKHRSSERRSTRGRPEEYHRKSSTKSSPKLKSVNEKHSVSDKTKNSEDKTRLAEDKPREKSAHSEKKSQSKGDDSKTLNANECKGKVEEKQEGKRREDRLKESNGKDEKTNGNVLKTKIEDKQESKQKSIPDERSKDASSKDEKNTKKEETSPKTKLNDPQNATEFVKGVSNQNKNDMAERHESKQKEKREDRLKETNSKDEKIKKQEVTIKNKLNDSGNATQFVKGDSNYNKNNMEERYESKQIEKQEERSKEANSKDEKVSKRKDVSLKNKMDDPDDASHIVKGSRYQKKNDMEERHESKQRDALEERSKEANSKGEKISKKQEVSLKNKIKDPDDTTQLVKGGPSQKNNNVEERQESKQREKREDRSKEASGKDEKISKKHEVRLKNKLNESNKTVQIVKADVKPKDKMKHHDKEPSKSPKEDFPKSRKSRRSHSKEKIQHSSAKVLKLDNEAAAKLNRKKAVHDVESTSKDGPKENKCATVAVDTEMTTDESTNKSKAVHETSPLSDMKESEAPTDVAVDTEPPKSDSNTEKLISEPLMDNQEDKIEIPTLISNEVSLPKSVDREELPENSIDGIQMNPEVLPSEDQVKDHVAATTSGSSHTQAEPAEVPCLEPEYVDNPFMTSSGNSVQILPTIDPSVKKISILDTDDLSLMSNVASISTTKSSTVCSDSDHVQPCSSEEPTSKPCLFQFAEDVETENRGNSSVLFKSLDDISPVKLPFGSKQSLDFISSSEDIHEFMSGGAQTNKSSSSFVTRVKWVMDKDPTTEHNYTESDPLLGGSQEDETMEVFPLGGGSADESFNDNNFIEAPALDSFELLLPCKKEQLSDNNKHLNMLSDFTESTRPKTPLVENSDTTYGNNTDCSRDYGTEYVLTELNRLVTSSQNNAFQGPSQSTAFQFIASIDSMNIMEANITMDSVKNGHSLNKTPNESEVLPPSAYSTFMPYSANEKVVVEPVEQCPISSPTHFKNDSAKSPPKETDDRTTKQQSTDKSSTAAAFLDSVRAVKTLEEDPEKKVNLEQFLSRKNKKTKVQAPGSSNPVQHKKSDAQKKTHPSEPRITSLDYINEHDQNIASEVVLPFDEWSPPPTFDLQAKTPVALPKNPETKTPPTNSIRVRPQSEMGRTTKRGCDFGGETLSSQKKRKVINDSVPDYDAIFDQLKQQDDVNKLHAQRISSYSTYISERSGGDSQLRNGKKAPSSKTSERVSVGPSSSGHYHRNQHSRHSQERSTPASTSYNSKSDPCTSGDYRPATRRMSGEQKVYSHRADTNQPDADKRSNDWYLKFKERCDYFHDSPDVFSPRK